MSVNTDAREQLGTFKLGFYTSAVALLEWCSPVILFVVIPVILAPPRSALRAWSVARNPTQRLVLILVLGVVMILEFIRAQVVPIQFQVVRKIPHRVVRRAHQLEYLIVAMIAYVFQRRDFYLRFPIAQADQGKAKFAPVDGIMDVAILREPEAVVFQTLQVRIAYPPRVVEFIPHARLHLM
jgi:hypothetical protein